MIALGLSAISRALANEQSNLQDQVRSLVVLFVRGSRSWGMHSRDQSSTPTKSLLSKGVT